MALILLSKGANETNLTLITIPYHCKLGYDFEPFGPDGSKFGSQVGLKDSRIAII